MHAQTHVYYIQSESQMDNLTCPAKLISYIGWLFEEMENIHRSILKVTGKRLKNVHICCTRELLQFVQHTHIHAFK